MDVIRVSGSSRTAAVAGAIAGVVREHQRAEVQAIGASAVNQAVKAIIYATNFLAEDGIDVVFVPEFVDVEIEEKIRTAIKFTVAPRQLLDLLNDKKQLIAMGKKGLERVKTKYSWQKAAKAHLNLYKKILNLK